MAIPIVAAAGAFARKVATNALVGKVKERLGDAFGAEAGRGWSLTAWGTFGVSFLGFILVLAVAGGAAGEFAGVNNPREAGSSVPCTALEDSTTMSVEEIEAFLESRKSPLKGTGDALLAAAQEFGVNPALMLGIAAAESSLGKNGRAVDNHNPGNIKTSEASLLAAGFQRGADFLGHDDQGHVIFSNWAAGWRGLAEVLRRFYLDNKRKTLEDIAEKYLTGNKPNWIRNVTATMNQAVGGCEEEDEVGESPGLGRLPPKLQEPLEPLVGECRDLEQFYGQGLTVDWPNDKEGLPKGEIRRLKDQSLVYVNRTICGSLLEIVNTGLQPTVTCIVCNHTQLVKGTTRESQHWKGNAMDLGSDCAIARHLFENRDRYQIWDLISGQCPDYNINDGQPATFGSNVLNSHMDHLHVGFK
jgi:hypothetical protein